MKKMFIITALTLGMAAAYSAMPPPEKVERLLEGIIIQDNFMDEDDSLPDVPLRRRDSLSRFTPFILRNGCTTNEFVEALMLAATNSSYSLEWTEDQKNTIAGRALWVLSEMDRPDVTNFVRIVNADGKQHFRYTDFSTPFIHTNLEPEIMEYMRSQCVRTNLYECQVITVMLDMLDTLSTIPPPLQSAATNRVAQYMYFALGHTTRCQVAQDQELIKLVPAYSNSLQRLSMMKYVVATETNAYPRTYAQNAVQILSAQPTNTLNNLTWITE